jgi:hypothetical protein
MRTESEPAEVIWQVAPWCSGSQDPEDAIEDAPVVHPRHTTRLVRQHWLDDSPLLVSEFVAHDSPRHGLESRLGGQTQPGPREEIWSLSAGEQFLTQSRTHGMPLGITQLRMLTSGHSAESAITRFPRRKVMRRCGCSPCAALKMARASWAFAARARTRSTASPTPSCHSSTR